MRLSKIFGNYNPRRYSKPWIAIVSAWPIGGYPTLKWGSYLGDDSGGEVEIEGNPGDIIRWGQKDNRGNNTEAYWGIVQDDGEIISCTMADARKSYRG